MGACYRNRLFVATSLPECKPPTYVCKQYPRALSNILTKRKPYRAILSQAGWCGLRGADAQSRSQRLLDVEDVSLQLQIKLLKRALAIGHKAAPEHLFLLQQSRMENFLAFVIFVVSLIQLAPLCCTCAMEWLPCIAKAVSPKTLPNA